MLDILKNEKSEFYNLDWFKKANNSAERLSLLDLNSIIKKTIYFFCIRLTGFQDSLNKIAKPTVIMAYKDLSLIKIRTLLKMKI